MSIPPAPHNRFDWHARFLLLGRVEGRWVFCRWIEERTLYSNEAFTVRRLPTGGAA